MRLGSSLLWLVIVGCGACGGGGGDDGFSTDPTAIDALVVTPDGNPVAGRDVQIISSDGMVQMLKTDAKGHAVAFLATADAQATVFSDAKNTEGRYMVQGVVAGDHLCLGCTHTTTACAGMPSITGLSRIADGWVWTISGDGAYTGMAISWKPNASNPNGAGHLLSPPGNTSASTASSADITIELIARTDVPTYDDLRTLSVKAWTAKPFCAVTAHAP